MPRRTAAAGPARRGPGVAAITGCQMPHRWALGRRGRPPPAPRGLRV